MKSGNPFVMATIAWALAAVASNTKNNDQVQAARLDASTKEALYFTEKQMSNALFSICPNFILQICNLR